MASFVNGCVFVAASAGTGSFVVSAAATGWQTPAQAGAVNAATYSYRAYSADLTEWEIGTGVYTSGTTTLTRVPSASTNGGAAVNFTAAPTIALTMLATDFITGSLGTTANEVPRASGTTGLIAKASGIQIDDSKNLSPVTTDVGALGTTSFMWADLFLASGGVINWNNGDVTITHSSNTLAFGGASSGYTFDAAVTPSSNDAAALGSATVSWADLFLASGGVINFANGNWVATHTSGILTVGTGDLRVTTAGTNSASVVTVGGTQTLTNKTLTSPTLTTPLTIANGGTGVSTGAFLKVVVQVFTADGTYTPTAGMLYAIVEAVGGGGGGGGVVGSSGNGSGGGGGGGAYARKVVTAADIGASKAVDIGAAGGGGSAGDNDGTAGASTTLGTTIVVAAGGGLGTGAATNSFSAGGAGGSTGTGDIVIPGQSGVAALYSTGTGSFIHSFIGGGNSGMSLGQGGRSTINTTGSAATGYGGGGAPGHSGGGGGDQAGGAGTAGIMIITEFCNQ